MRIALLATLIAALSTTLPIHPDNPPASVFITAGQSNAEGRAPASAKPSYLDNGYRHLNYAFVRSIQDGKFGKYSFGDTFAFCDVTHFLIDQALERDFYAIKCTYGGTAITPGQTEEWEPIWYASEAWLAHNKAHNSAHGGMSLTLSLTEGVARCITETLCKLPHGYDIKAIMWHQGESDRKNPEAYYENFKEMITFMREQIYATTGNEKDRALPFIFGTVPHLSRQYSPIVEAAQFRVAQELPNVYIIDLSDAVLLSDELHFNATWTEHVGKLMYNKLIELGLIDAHMVKAAKPTDTDSIAPPKNGLYVPYKSRFQIAKQAYTTISGKGGAYYSATR